ncbi:hypothetical protein OIU84_019363 [Salix udensis]|uniref:Uncharacterized protein n=1 Tax=Salix udensis TaxID=889485 RepID=A0AAD6KYQ1_9ROSI|nr:hypothetical protein OIU84_019363 [Salix udensis]KAJ6432089.1 hypothetical protein OIU84_019363 [Salix udensis]KAJ6432090.1 hypothetical protein OIU84_019363 [Salix udensis]KAJ6432091.1 hypothetical protein OIU84_019363 [Salix udensis]KAJ6432092.1 hypothetical protein OIU84_019363 [Salix udensis]
MALDSRTNSRSVSSQHQNAPFWRRLFPFYFYIFPPKLVSTFPINLFIADFESQREKSERF